MGFTMIENKFKKGDMVVREDSIYIIANTDQLGYVTAYGIRLSELKDDVINIGIYASQDEFKEADEYQVNQIGYLIREIRRRILNDEPIFAYKKERG